ncbi:MAG TPA: hypothetical protein PLM79_02245 [Syntrophobacteraceae bacterium]|nr:hypothetical protein [Syntrophobacteraceae bacterium]
MEYERVQVLTRDEYREAQEPISFQWRNNRYRIREIVDRWYSGYLDARRVPLRYFKVKTQDGKEFILRYHELFRAWSLLVPPGEEEERDP